jgi:hypothetical protein
VIPAILPPPWPVELGWRYLRGSLARIRPKGYLLDGYGGYLLNGESDSGTVDSGCDFNLR